MPDDFEPEKTKKYRRRNMLLVHAVELGEGEALDNYTKITFEEAPRAQEMLDWLVKYEVGTVDDMKARWVTVSSWNYRPYDWPGKQYNDYICV